MILRSSRLGTRMDEGIYAMVAKMDNGDWRLIKVYTKKDTQFELVDKSYRDGLEISVVSFSHWLERSRLTLERFYRLASKLPEKCGEEKE